MIKCILFDRDGTLGELSDLRFPETFRPFTDIRSVFLKLKKFGYSVGIISNQSSIARGTAKNYDYAAEFSSYGADVWKICPHDRADNCDCRKPKSGLLLSAAAQLNISPTECLVVGDRLSDILCAKNAGAKAALVLTGYAEKEETLRAFPNIPVLIRFDDIFKIL